jgi:septal ring factor EnvC (AmiA/AmiB activator)
VKLAENRKSPSRLRVRGVLLYCRGMKKIFPMVAAAVMLALPVSAQDAATQERMDKLEGQIKDVLDAQADLQRRLSKLANELSALHDKVSSANGTVASQEDLKRLADKIQQIDRNRENDKELILRKIEELAKIERTPAPPRPNPRPPTSETPPARNPDEKGFKYVIQQGDSISAVVEAYRQQGIKTSVNEILKANPGLNPNKLRVNQEIWIPAPKQ